MERLQTSDHRLIINEAGVLIFAADEDCEDTDLDRSAAQEGQFHELRAAADYVNANRDKLMRLQQELECTWAEVADEIINSMEAARSGSAVEAPITDTQRLLETLGSVTRHPRPEPIGIAGRWYQSMWTEDAYPSTFLQQWTPFLRVLHQRKLERFPDAYAVNYYIKLVECCSLCCG
jgi:hypothetical protein